MIKPFSDIWQDLLSTWPNLKHVWFSDRTYWTPSMEEFRTAVLEQNVRDIKLRPRVMECEEFALLLRADLVRWALKQIEEIEATGEPIPDSLNHSWAVGRARGMNMQSAPTAKSHDLLVAVLQEGIYLLEPQTYQIWKATESAKRTQPGYVYFVDM